MKTLRIGLIAAMPEEVTPLLRKMGVSEINDNSRQPVIRFSQSGHDIWLIISGMGSANASTATRTLINNCAPDSIVSLGFAGSLSPKLHVGDIVLAERILLLHDGQFSEQQTVRADMPENIGIVTIPATFVTTGEVMSKKELFTRLPDRLSTAVVEMETAAVAQIASAEHIPLLAIRAISDGFDEELAFTLDEFCDKEMHLQRWRVLLKVAKNPSIIPQLIKLSRNLKIASEALAAAVSGFLSTTGDTYRLPPATDNGKSRM